MADCASTAHLLANGRPDEVIEQANANAIAKAKADPNAPIDMAEEIKAVERKIKADKEAAAERARKRKEDEEEAERKKAERRAALKAEVKYTSTQVTQGHGSNGQKHNVGGGGKVITWSKHKGTAYHDLPQDFLEWVVHHDPPMKGWQTGPCWGELKRRGNAEKQASSPARPAARKEQLDFDAINRMLEEANYEDRARATAGRR